MALVMLPCDLPWWPQVQRHLTQLALARSSKEFIEGMLKIHNMCNISLDPDEETPDPTMFSELETFLEKELQPEERRHFLEHTTPAMVQRALQLKQFKPPSGLRFSLQQQADHVELERSFVASLLAHAFFSTFPKRTVKTHPTLQDFNFTNFFKHLDNSWQKAKLRSVLQYFDYLESNGLPEQKITFSRQVMTGRDWLTIEDWLECGLPLCPLLVRHEGRLDRAEAGALHVCFASSHLGGRVLGEGTSQECLQFCTQPELLTMLSCVEALEDNEVVAVEGVMQTTRITGPRHRAVMEVVSQPPLMSVCCMDAENYMRLPMSQYEEDNVLRELNKALLGFRQQLTPDLHHVQSPQQQQTPHPASKRLSPIGESCSSTPPEKVAPLPSPPPPPPPVKVTSSKSLLRPPSPMGGRRGRFIVLGSSGECLPVSRAACSVYSSCHSESDEEYHSARTSLEKDDSESEDCARRYSAQLDTPERRSTFAARLRDALCREAQSSISSDSSYAVGITIAGAELQDGDIRVRRGGSRGFMLQEDSSEDRVMRDNLQQEVEESERRRQRQAGFKGKSSCYSFSTEYSSELEELYDQYSHWLEDADAEGGRELDARDIAVVRFASSLLKRTLSDSFAGVPLLEGQEHEKNRTKLALVARSLSMELARHNHRLAAQLVSMLGTVGKKNSSGLRPVATGNWGCGSTHVGDPQLKLVVQWLAASVAGVPSLQYYTCGHHKLLKLDTVVRVLRDRQWTVGELASATLRHAQATLHAPTPPHTTNSLFDELIGTEKPVAPIDTNL
ncbi:uncharacterized protein [Anabrus simplex]|uniref:uncharacterized protein n=1 Tax=Anabrus simplex TaxID=316456 RepID=UPI0035A3811F